MHLKEEEKFLSKRHLVQAGWRILLALVIGVGAYAMGVARTHVSGQDKVIIATPDDGAAPLVVRLDSAENDPQREFVESIERIAVELRQLREFEADRQGNPLRSVQQEPTKSLLLNRPTIPAFEMPSAVRGYKRTSLSGLAQASCPPPEVMPDDLILIEMRMAPSTNTAALTPVFVRVDRPNPNGGLYHVFGQQYDLQPELNSFRIPVNLRPGSYHLEIGFYVRADLQQEFPKYHSIRCPIRVLGEG